MQKGSLKLITFLSLILQFGYSISQNLVPNGSFETYTTCPPSSNANTPDYITYATGWHSSRNTPDYFNSCSSPTSVGVPFNNFGSQSAFDGNAYCGFWAYFVSGLYREVFSSQLNTPLVIGQKYFVSMRVSLADKPSYSYCGVDKLGALFSTKLYDLTNNAPINNWAHIFTNTIIVDSLNWTLINGSFIADSAYKYISIGHFFNDANTNKILLNPSSISYYYVDDIRVATDSLFGLSLNIKAFDNSESQISIFPNPNNGSFTFLLPNMKTAEQIKIIDAYGKIIFSDYHVEVNKILDFSSLPNGFYTIQIINNNQSYQSKIIIQK